MELFILGFITGAIGFAVIFNVIHVRVVKAFESKVHELTNKIQEVFEKATIESEKDGEKLDNILKKL
jgi:hypothetical protein